MLATFSKENNMSTKKEKGKFRSYKNFEKEDFIQDLYQAQLYMADIFDNANNNYCADGFCEWASNHKTKNSQKTPSIYALRT